MRQSTFSANLHQTHPVNSGTKFRRLCVTLCPHHSITAKECRVWLQQDPRLCVHQISCVLGSSVAPGFTSSCACGDHTTQHNPHSCAVPSLLGLNHMQRTNMTLIMALTISTQSTQSQLDEDGQVTRVCTGYHRHVLG